MNERVFSSIEEYEEVYFPRKTDKSLFEPSDSIARQLATRAIEEHCGKLKSIKCAEPVNAQERS